MSKHKGNYSHILSPKCRTES